LERDHNPSNGAVDDAPEAGEESDGSRQG